MSQIPSVMRGEPIGLVAVFVPMAFLPGTTHGIYRQFSVTLAVSIAFSALMALTITPALCATLLKPHEEISETSGNRVSRTAGRFFGGGAALFPGHVCAFSGVFRGELRAV